MRKQINFITTYDKSLHYNNIMCMLHTLANAAHCISCTFIVVSVYTSISVAVRVESIDTKG